MKIKTSVIWSNRSGRSITWFHPKCCKLSNGSLLMVLQSISGSDFYGPVCESISHDGRRTWSDPVEIPGLGLRELDEGISEGICDVVPCHHVSTDTVLAIGHNVYNKNGAHFNFLSDKDARSKQSLAIVPYWSVRNADGEWVKVRQKLEIPGFEECSLYTCGCTQWFFRGENEVLIPFYCKCKDSRINVCSVKFFYDGTKLEFLEKGEALEHPEGYDFVEPSMIETAECVIMTLRSNDKRAYVTKSADALHWEKPEPWQFDNGEVLTIFSTQQHLLRCGGRNWLLYTRETDYNKGVKRFRTPMFIAEINSDLKLIRDSETIIFPMIDEDGGGAGMGNFHVIPLSDTEALVTVGEERSYDHFRGDTLEAYIKF